MGQAMKQLYDISHEDGRITFNRQGTCYAMESDDPALLAAVPFLQLDLPVRCVATLTGVRQDTLAALASQIAGTDLAPADGEAASPITGAEFYDRFRRVLPDWMREAFGGTYWRAMLSGEG